MKKEMRKEMKEEMREEMKEGMREEMKEEQVKVDNHHQRRATINYFVFTCIPWPGCSVRCHS